MKCRVPEKLTVTQLVKIFETFYENRKIITVFSRTRSLKYPDTTLFTPHFHTLLL